MGSGICKPEQVNDEKLQNYVNRTKQIEAEILKEKMESRKIIKILLLGTSDSGKSTIAKQMRILHKNGFKETELINFRYMIYSNLLNSYHWVAKGIYQLCIPVRDKENDLIDRFNFEHFLLYDIEDEEQIKILEELKSYSCVKELMVRKNEVYLPDNTHYFFDQLDRILSPDYTPNVMDVLHARSPTSGVYEISFAFKSFTIRLIDVGGQKTERRKWIHCFDNVMAILFVVALNSYDQFTIDDPKKNCMVDSVELFVKMFKNPHLSKCSFILFFNKKDLFEEKLKYCQLKQYYTKYIGENDYESASKFIEHLFTKYKQELRQIYTHFTNAVDTENIDFVFRSTCDIILQNNFSRSGMA